MTSRTDNLPPFLSIVAPVYNEKSVLESFLEEIREALRRLSIPVRYEIVLVDDGSNDGTAELLDRLTDDSVDLRVIHLCRNFGHAAAISAGLNYAQGDAVILMDADLQDDPSAFNGFLEKWREGYQVVYAVRASRKEIWPLRLATAAFYRILSWISNTWIPQGAGTFSLMDRRVVQVLRSMPERSRFLPGLRAWVGFRQVAFPVPRRLRYDLRSRVGFRGLWRLSMNAVFSFSYFPIFLFRACGALSLLGCWGLAAFVLYHKLFTGQAVTAWTSQMLSTLFFGGINLLGIGIIGEYVARIYDELKKRPEYIVDRITGSTASCCEESPRSAENQNIRWAASSSSSHR